VLGRKADVFMRPYLLWHFLKCLPICHHESNHCYSCCMCSASDGSNNALFMVRQQNTEGLTDNKISVIEQLTCKNMAFIVVLHETNYITADKLVIPNF